jgi:prolyl-tRNA synthetase
MAGNKDKREALGVTVKKDENFSEWYNDVVLKADLVDYAPTKGCMIIKALGFGIWENIKKVMDAEFKKTGVRNYYFPLFIPESTLKKEAEHFEGFTPEVAWVTHGGDTKLSEKLAIRPTSETIMYEVFSKWIRSWRDLPLLTNQWCNVVRWETKATKLFLRTREFLWQEGHTVHATKGEADKQVLEKLEIYKKVVEEYLAIPVIKGVKSEMEKFAGALYTTTIESLMSDGKALQMGTSHNLGQHFAEVFDIKFSDKDGKEKLVWQTSWGTSTRLIGALVMVHGDDKGVVLPPKIAPIHVVIIPINFHEDKKVLKEAEKIRERLEKKGYNVEMDDREEYSPGWKFNEWELKGIPVRIEIGTRDLKNQEVVMVRRDTLEKSDIKISDIEATAEKMLDDIQKNLYKKAKKFLESNTRVAENKEQFKDILKKKKGLIKIKWCENRECEEAIKDETGATSRLKEFKQKKISGKCAYCGKEAKAEWYFSKSY